MIFKVRPELSVSHKTQTNEELSNGRRTYNKSTLSVQSQDGHRCICILNPQSHTNGLNHKLACWLAPLCLTNPGLGSLTAPSNRLGITATCVIKEKCTLIPDTQKPPPALCIWLVLWFFSLLFHLSCQYPGFLATTICRPFHFRLMKWRHFGRPIDGRWSAHRGVLPPSSGENRKKQYRNAKPLPWL